MRNNERKVNLTGQDSKEYMHKIATKAVSVNIC